MTDDTDDRDDIEARLDRLESTLDELREAIVEDDRIDAGRVDAGRPTRLPGETALRMTERLVVPAAVAALEANVRALEFVQDRLRDLERREPATDRPVRGEVSEGVLDRLDEALSRMEDAMSSADLPRNAEARRLLERARDLNAEVRGRAREPVAGPSGPEVVRIDVEEELEDIREEVGAEAAGEGDPSGADDETDEDET